MSVQFGAAADFATVRDFLATSGYTADAVCERMGIAALSQSLTMQAGAPADDALEALIHCFLLGAEVDVERFIPPAVREAMVRLGLLESARATVELYPVGQLYIVSDRNRGDELPAGEDKVFSAITPQTEDFLAMLPETPCPALLELCAGAGAAALLGAASYATHAFAYDLAPRSVRFAEFNRRLNGIANFTAKQGDLYAPAGRQTFDRIVAHPPYVPTLHATELLRDGGEVGEALTRRVFGGLPAYLHPGGRLYCLALLAEVRGESISDRLRRWIGSAEMEYDVVVIVRRRVDPARLVFDNWRERGAQPGDIARWQYIFKHRRIESFAYCSMIVERHAESRSARTLLRETTGGHPRAEVEALLAPAPVEGTRWCVNPGVRVVTEESLSGKTVYRYAAETPFRTSLEGPQWVGDFLRTGGPAPAGADISVLEALRDEGLIVPE